VKFTPWSSEDRAPPPVQSARMPTDFVKASLNHNDKRVTDLYAWWRMFEEKLETVRAIETAALSSITGKE
jgi:hypothetical protein